MIDRHIFVDRSKVKNVTLKHQVDIMDISRIKNITAKQQVEVQHVQYCQIGTIT